MPATHAALARVLAAVAATGIEPRSHVDLGGGTGAAAWAAAESFWSLEEITVLDHADRALRMGERLVEKAPREVLRGAHFTRAVAGGWPEVTADLVTVSYVLSELDAAQQSQLLADAMAIGQTVVVVEPGTPDGYERILLARNAIRGSRLAAARSLSPFRGVPSRRLETGATSLLASTGRQSIAGSRAVSFPTRTRSSRGSQALARMSLCDNSLRAVSCVDRSSAKVLSSSRSVDPMALLARKSSRADTATAIATRVTRSGATSCPDETAYGAGVLRRCRRGGRRHRPGRARCIPSR